MANAVCGMLTSLRHPGRSATVAARSIRRPTVRAPVATGYAPILAAFPDLVGADYGHEQVTLLTTTPPPVGDPGKLTAGRGLRLGRGRPGRRAGAVLAEHGEIDTGPDARGPKLLLIVEGADRWTVRQIIDDPAGDHDGGISAEVDRAESDELGTAAPSG